MLMALWPAWAQETIGFVKTVTGKAAVTDAGKLIDAQVGTPIKMGNILKTGPQATMGVTFKDNTVMSFGPDTEITVDEYLYAPGKGDLKFSTSMAKGSMQVVSGVIAKLKPQAVTVKTQGGLIGCRGTRFLVKVEP
ncbi:MAG: FecR domain-containing protein [Deltaproteobacteria bacterium]|nr:FecR domain-containing protein [Deltaproteobacteria bacterium]